MTRWLDRLEQLSPEIHAGSEISEIPEINFGGNGDFGTKAYLETGSDLGALELHVDYVVWLPEAPSNWVGATSPRLPKKSRLGSDAVLCAICGRLIPRGLGAVAIRTANIKERWIHEGACYAEFATWHQNPSTMTREGAQELFARAKRAGRLLNALLMPEVACEHASVLGDSSSERIAPECRIATHSEK